MSALLHLNTLASWFKVSQFNILPHFEFIFCGPGQKFILFLNFRVFPNLRYEISVPTPFWASIYCLCLQLWSLGCINNAPIMSSGSELMSESTENRHSNVLYQFYRTGMHMTEWKPVAGAISI